MHKQNAIKRICLSLIATLFFFSFGTVFDAMSSIAADVVSTSNETVISTFSGSLDVIAENVKPISPCKEIIRNSRSRFSQRMPGRFLSCLIPMILFAIVSLFMYYGKVFESEGIHYETISYIQDSDGKK